FDDQATEMNVREMIKALVEKKANRPKDENHLTTREREVLKMLAEGDSLKEIANKLNLSAKTVEAHKFRIYKKLGIHNKAHLVAYAIQAKIIRLPAMDEGRPELDRLTVPAVG
ncbi:response regulator transcription factor, partial [Patescibacteria group bacterium]